MQLLPITGDFVRALGWTILHSMWQACLIYACLRIVFKLWPQAGAKIKYNLSLLSLSGIFTWFLATLFMHIQRLADAREAATQMVDTAYITTPNPVMYHGQEPLVWLFPNLEGYFPFLVTLYVAGIAIMTIKLLSDLFHLQRIRTTHIESMGNAWDKHLDKLAARLQIPRKVKVLISQHVQVPVMLGFLKPLILLPIAMVNNLSEEQLEAVLLHELAHIKRNDYLLNIFQSIVETILFFNPFVWLISKAIRIEREHCCDDLVIASTVQPLQYAHALVALEEYRLTANRLTMAAANSKQHLFHRIKRIMEMKTKNLNYSQKFLAVLIIATGLVSIAWFNPAKGKEHKTAEHPVDTTAPKSNTARETGKSASGTFRQQLDVASPAPAANAVEIKDVVLPEPASSMGPLAPLQTGLGPMPSQSPSPMTNQAKDQSINVQIEDVQDLSVDNVKIQDLKIDDIVHQNVTANVKVNTQNHLFTRNHVFYNDTTVDREEIRKQIAAAQKSIDAAMRQLKNVDMKKVQEDIRIATQNINMANLSAEVKKAQAESMAALKDIDWDKLTSAQQEAAKALKNIDFDAINRNVSKSLNNALRSMQTDKFHFDTTIDKEEVRKQREEGLANAARTREAARRTREGIGRTREGAQRNAEAAQREQDTRNREKEARIREKEARNREIQAEKRNKEAAQREQDARKRAAEAEQREKDAKNRDIQAEKRDKEAAQREQDAQKRAAEADQRAKDAEKRSQEAAERAKQAEKRSAEAADRARKNQEMIEKMAADKLIDPSQKYTIEKNSGGLFINGVKQPESVYSKYEQYLQGGRHVTIKKS
ncbi:beta-lactamase regulating signal transducer with metallopeptidase domain [Chitinophaga polysaccharea]|uniref:Beta-lactamase regulating signal transducer with metallopeptidase domain n=1 Tax=Chitinophaga polysaccharea TaxID=1293035 RepID=A0A561P337_9BACT|nr:M56 family metallopeptidase [Chitinophaga polysaccharea]TWF32532.1 beta-lactamase regulating signal transducer with metallopeptidase domain [Chitinophaga polysaccharea]